ncbi:MAG: Ppx/GppA family phosphatase [Verrucomicrobiales bacterium]|nr:Ppx/GppA family phosphatase [Verrucomicrobiales bacterium]
MKEESNVPASNKIPAAKKGVDRRAVIDVGTNSVKLLVADIKKKHVEPILEKSEQTRLGRGFYETHRLQADAIKLTADAVAEFVKTARSTGAASIRIIATSAARDAKNPQDLITAIETRAHLPLEVISGEQEAELAFRGVCTDAKLTRSPLLILDVGGGSTEFILGEDGHQQFRESFQLGTVRLLEQLPHSDPPSHDELEGCRVWLRHFLHERVAPKLLPALQAKAKVKLVGTGGTTTILARMQHCLDTFDRDMIESTPLSRSEIQAHVEKLWRMPLKERQNIVGLPPKRADVILFGTVIFEAIMEQFNFEELQVSMRGLRYAALLEN